MLDWAEKHHAADPHAVFLVITARDHGSFGYKTSFNWLMKHFPYPFIGPFARPVDDPRFTTEFKRELTQGFEDMAYRSWAQPMTTSGSSRCGNSGPSTT